jgi:hypothetical protein
MQDKEALNKYIQTIINGGKPLFDADQNLIVQCDIIGDEGKEWKTMRLSEKILALGEEQSILIRDSFKVSDGSIPLNWEGVLYFLFTNDAKCGFNPLYIGISRIYGKSKGKKNTLFSQTDLARWDYRRQSGGHIDKLNAEIFGENGGHTLTDKDGKPKSTGKKEWGEHLFTLETDEQNESIKVKMKKRLFLYYKCWDSSQSILKLAYGFDQYTPTLDVEEQILIHIFDKVFPGSLLNKIGTSH